MRTHCPACKKAVPPNIDACPYCPMSFEELEKKPKSEVAGAGPAVAMVLIFGLMGLFLISHQDREKKDGEAAKTEAEEKPPEPEVEVNVHNQPPPLGLQTELTKSRAQEAASGGPTQTGPLPDPEKSRLGQVEAPRQPNEAGGVWGPLAKNQDGSQPGGGSAGASGAAMASPSPDAAPASAGQASAGSGVYGPLGGNRPSAAQASADRAAAVREARRGRGAAAENEPPIAERAAPAAAPSAGAPRSSSEELEPRATASEASAARRVSRDEPSSSGAARAEEEEAAKEWRFRGTVYDLSALAPVAGMAVVFTDHESNARYETATDAAGRYRTVLPALADRGYDVLLAHPRYSPAFLMGTLRRYKAVPQAKRREMARQLVGSVEKKGSLQPEGGAPLLTDFFVAPASLR